MAEPIALLLLSTLITLQRTVNQHCSRKTFLARVAGLFAAVGVFSRRAMKATPPRAVPSPAASAPIALRAEPRAVPRRADSV